ncbi:DUF2971 domain-containing protein [Massilia sp. GCM10020059]|uniref:DUF2971 domain-containing protein n=1 Tax=Massilia agrisoli TaxID=2892444 RepID=A0ABS8ISS9_9BURK|nr:DUF2971 domain-containing protein [Massilia agrisoli]MCC6071475.1 DUF2971 domain-containing protein [Massilia agrisoli]
MYVPPPPILYKYYPVESWLADLIKGESLLFSSRTTFNDPYDSRSVTVIDTSDAGLKWLLDSFQRRLPHWPPALRLANAKQAHRRMAKPDRPGAQDEVAEMLDRVGILSLTENWDDMLMWSHYGAQHKGICIGFHTNSGVFRGAMPVTYTEEYPLIKRPQDEIPVVFVKSLFTKAKCWEYEREWRILKRFMLPGEAAALRQTAVGLSEEDLNELCDQRGAGIYTFDNAAIASITLGSRAQDHAPTVIKACLDAGIDVPVYWVQPPSHSYKLDRRLWSEKIRRNKI